MEIRFQDDRLDESRYYYVLGDGALKQFNLDGDPTRYVPLKNLRWALEERTGVVSGAVMDECEPRGFFTYPWLVNVTLGRLTIGCVTWDVYETEMIMIAVDRIVQ
jgi:hypothetical protein